MGLTDFTERAMPFVQNALDDSDVTDRLQNAGRAGVSAVARARSSKSSNVTAAARAGEALREAGASIVALTKVSSKPPKKRTPLVPVLLVGGVIAAAAVVVLRQGSETEAPATPQPGPTT
jgi:hypothetical protein